MERLINQLKPYLPVGTAPVIADWIVRTNCEFRIAGNRKSKLGDYRAPYGGRGHRISVNYNLNPYAFLITTVHEFAHLQTWQRHGARVKPHGVEWKAGFRQLMTPFFERNIFPDDIRIAIGAYLQNPAASSCGDLQLFRTLSRYDESQNRPQGYTYLENIPDGNYFKTRDGRLFQKSEKIRVRFRCREISTRRIYLFSPVAEVLPQREGGN